MSSTRAHGLKLADEPRTLLLCYSATRSAAGAAPCLPQARAICSTAAAAAAAPAALTHPLARALVCGQPALSHLPRGGLCCRRPHRPLQRRSRVGSAGAFRARRVERGSGGHWASRRRGGGRCCESRGRWRWRWRRWRRRETEGYPCQQHATAAAAAAATAILRTTCARPRVAAPWHEREASAALLPLLCGRKPQWQRCREWDGRRCA